MMRRRKIETKRHPHQQLQQPLLQEPHKQCQAGPAPVTQPEQQQQQQLSLLHQQQRSTTVVLYHQTSLEIARAILSTGQMKPGSKGYGGAGIYFAAAPEITTAKATKKGVILECEVALGKVKEISCSGDWSSRIWHWLYDYDSIKITSIGDGTEWVVFDSSRVTAVRLWGPGVGVEQLALLLLLLAANAAAVLQCAMVAVAQMMQQISSCGLQEAQLLCTDGRIAAGCSKPSLRSCGKY